MVFRVALLGIGLLAALGLLLWGMASAAQFLLRHKSELHGRKVPQSPAKQRHHLYHEVLDVEAREVASDSTELPGH
jgi:hypothetical protein